MRTLKNVTQLYVWSRDVEPLMTPAAGEMLSMLSDCISDELWSLCVLRDLAGNHEVLATTSKKGNLRVKSTAKFERRFGCRVAVTLSRKSLPASALEGSSAFLRSKHRC